MDFLFLLVYSLLEYGWWWIMFVGVVFCAARYTPWPCIPLAFLVVAALMVYQDVTWIERAMAKPDWNGNPDMDIVFLMGAVVRVVLVGLILLPFALFGRRLKRRRG